MAGNIYSRYMNPNVDEFVEKMNMLENAEDGIAFSTGMAAIFASMAGLLKAGDHIVASNALFGSCIQILTKITSKWGLVSSFKCTDIILVFCPYFWRFYFWPIRN
jgi:O-succinylhomoserine sulfhydrylase